MPVPPINVVDDHGNTASVAPEELGQAMARGYHVESATENTQRLTGEARDEEFGGVGGAVEAGGQAALRGATLGLSDVAQRAIGGEDTRRHLANLEAQNSTVSTVGNVLGSLAPALLTGGATLPESLVEGGLAAGAEALGSDVGATSLRGALSAVADASPVSMVGRLGAATSDAVGGGLLGRGIGGAVEGGLYGAGQGLSDVALSDDPLTVENVVGHITSDALLGAGVGGGLSVLSHGLGSALKRASSAVSDAQAARATLASVPEDLAAMDGTALKTEMKTATAAHAADQQAEVDSLESLRREQRAEIANQILDVHEDMRASKIYQAVNDDFTKMDGVSAGVEKIDGIPTAQRQLASSNGVLSRLTKNPIALQESPGQALAALQQRQAALETMMDKMPELRTALADNPAGAGLDSVEGALAHTKGQIDAIKTLDSKANPVTSTRLQLLKAGPSARMDAITTARDALAKGQELGIVGKAVRSIAKTAATGAGFIAGGAVPGVGHLAGAAVGNWLGGQASSAVEWAARKLAGTATKAADATAIHLESFLSTAGRVGKAAKAPAVALATKTLSTVRFGNGASSPSTGDDLGDLFRARSGELKAQTAYAPDGSVQITPAARQQIASTFDGLRGIAPIFADRLESAAVARVEHLSSLLPRKPDAPEGAMQFGPDTWHPSDLEIRSWARHVRAAEDPASVEQRLAHGVMTPEEAGTYQALYPQRFAALQQAIALKAPTLAKTLPMQKRLALSVFTGLPLVPTLERNVLPVIQASFAVEPNSAGGTQAPRAVPQYGSRGTPKDVDKPTPSQARQE